MASQCTDCGSAEVERDEQQGQVYCTGCGRVLQTYILLAQQQFQETSAGGITAVGQHVGEGISNPHTHLFDGPLSGTVLSELVPER